MNTLIVPARDCFLINGPEEVKQPFFPAKCIAGKEQESKEVLAINQQDTNVNRFMENLPVASLKHYIRLLRQSSTLDSADKQQKSLNQSQCQISYAAPFCWNLLLSQYIAANLKDEKFVLNAAEEQLERHYAALKASVLNSLLSEVEKLLELLEFISGLNQVERIFSTLDEEGCWVFLIYSSGGAVESYKHRPSKPLIASQESLGSAS